MKLRIVKSLSAYHAARKNAPAPKPEQKPGDEFDAVKRWESSLDLKGAENKSFEVVRNEAGAVVDYRNVKLRGYLSTFKGTTEADRDGDYVENGAFTETISEFMKNPVMLVDHYNSVSALAGRFTKVSEDQRGLFIEAEVSNSPDMLSVRYKIAEGILKSMSMGGIFYYKEDRKGIFRVRLWEGSLVSIPANQDALFQVRSLNDTEKKFLKSGGAFPTYSSFLHAERTRNQAELAA